MEERLQAFLEHCRQLQHSGESDAITSFLLHQVMELARDCLQKSQEKLVTSTYFYELSDSLEKLLIDVRICHTAFAAEDAILKMVSPLNPLLHNFPF